MIYKDGQVSPLQPPTKERVYAPDSLDTGGYTVREDGTVDYTDSDMIRNPFVVTGPDGKSSQDYSFQIGISKFVVPPTSIEVTEVYSNSAGAYTLRSKTSSKMSVGQRQKRITIRLMFPNLDEAWEGPNSLRGLVAQFRSAPFLPVYNTYLNAAHGVDALALVSLNVNTVPGMPFTMAAELVCYKFEWKPLVPWHGTFGGDKNSTPTFNEDGSPKTGDQGVFMWPEYQYYYERAKRTLDNYTSRPKDENNNGGSWSYDDASDKTLEELREDVNFVDWNVQDLESFDGAYNDALEAKFGKPMNDSLHRMEIYYSDREYSSLMWLNKLGAKKLTNSISSAQKEVGEWKTLASKIIENGLLLWFFKDDPVDPLAQGQDALKNAIGGDNYTLKNQYDAFMALASLSEYYIKTETDQQAKQTQMRKVDEKVAELLKKRPNLPPETARQVALYLVLQDTDVLTNLLSTKSLQKIFKDSNTSWIHEWELPMRRMGLDNEDLYHTVIVDGITVSTQNAIVALPLEGKVDPTCQYLGGLGTKATVTMKVIGERAIKHMREVFDSVCVGSSLNRDAGVTGFLGLKNDLIACLGMKYALLDTWSVSTIEGYPHVYQVTLNLSDFDIMQQKREMPSAVERVQMMEDSTVGHPAMRMSQILANTNAYPDLPLPRMMKPKIRMMPSKESYLDSVDIEWVTADGQAMTEDNPAIMVPGSYLDPDFYFRNAKLRLDNSENSYMKREEFEGNTGEKRNRPIPNFDQYGQVDLSSQGSDLQIALACKMQNGVIDGKWYDGFNVHISNRALAYDVNDIPVDKNNAQSIMNKQLTENAMRILKSHDIDAFSGDFQGMDRSAEWMAEAYANTGNGEGNTVDQQTLSSMTYLYGNSESNNFADMLEEDVDGTIEGMARAFPTYMVYLIDEGGKLVTFKLFDTFYGIQSLISADIMIDKEAPMDTAVLQFSNLYNKLSTAQWFSNFSMPIFIQNIYTAAWTARQRVFGLTNEIESVQMTPGMRMQIRMGYSANPEALPIIFNGTVTEVTNGAVMSVVCQGDGIELSRITGRNYKADASTYAFMGIPMVEPQDLICRYMGAANSVWSQWVRKASIGMNPGDGTNGLSHFGSILWDTTLFGGDAAFQAHVKATTDRIMVRLNTKTAAVAEYMSASSKESPEAGGSTGQVSWFNACINVLGGFTENAPDIIKQGFEDSQNLAEDFELIKRNVYPGNGTGYRTFPTGFALKQKAMSHLGTVIWSMITPSYMDLITKQSGQDTDYGPVNERTFKVNTGGKTNWEIFKMCESLLPNYILAVRPFNHRSTLFYGKPNWLYTSGVVPVFDADGMRNKAELTMKSPSANMFFGSKLAVKDSDQIDVLATLFGASAEEGYLGNNSGCWTLQSYWAFATNWIASKVARDFFWTVLPSAKANYTSAVAARDAFNRKWVEFLTWVSNDNLLTDAMLLMTVSDEKVLPLYSYTGPDLFDPSGIVQYQDRDKPWLAKIEAVKGAIYRYDALLLAGNSEAEVKAIMNSSFLETWTAAGSSYEGLKKLLKEYQSKLSVANDHTAENFVEIVSMSKGTKTSPGINSVTLPPKTQNNGLTTLMKSMWIAWNARYLPEYQITPSETPGEDVAINRGNQEAGGNSVPALGPDEKVKILIAETLEDILWSHWEIDTEEYKQPSVEYEKFEWVKSNIYSPSNSLNKTPNPTGKVDELSRWFHGHIIDASIIKDAISKLGTGIRPSFELNTRGYIQGDVGTPKNELADTNVGAKASLAYLSTFIAGGMDQMLDASYYNSSLATVQWDALQDSAYYGILEGTPSDPYAGSEYRNEDGSLDYSAMQGKVYNARMLQIACDNPFSREFAEPVIEIREPFSRFHYVTSERNLISNGIFADETNVANQVRAIAHTSSKNNAKKEVTVKADASIPSNFIREKIVDTGLNYEMFSWHDLENHKNMARKALKDSLQTMYGGELVIMGDPKMRPFDFLYLWDTPNQTNGWTEINRVTHHIGVDTGFTTSLSVAPIVVIDDAYLFGMFTAGYALQLDRVSRGLVAQNLSSGAFNVGGVQNNYENNNIQQVVQKSLALVDGNSGSYKTMQIMGAMIPAQAAFQNYDSILAQMNASTSSLMESWDKTQEKEFDALFASWLKWGKIGNGEAFTGHVTDTDTVGSRLMKKYGRIILHKNRNPENGELITAENYSAEIFGEIAEMFGYGQGAIDDDAQIEQFLIEIRDLMIKQIDLLMPALEQAVIAEELRKYAQDAARGEGGGLATVPRDDSAQSVASNTVLGTMLNVLEPGVAGTLQGVGTLGIGIGVGVNAAAAGGATAATLGEAGAVGLGALGAGGAAGLAAAAFVLAGLVSLGAGIGLQKIITWIAEQEPISIILLNQKGNPLQAGLKGADGIIAGQPATLPILDKFGVSLPSDDVSTIWNQLGYTLQEGKGFQQAESALKTRMINDIMKRSGRPELGVVPGLKTNRVIKTFAKENHDGDTITVDPPISYDGMDKSYISKPNTIRMKFIDTPEIDAKPNANMNDLFPGMSGAQAEYGAVYTRDWLQKKIGSTTDNSSNDRFSYRRELKVIVNTLQPADNYGRVLGILVTEESCAHGGDASLYHNDAYLESPQFDWLKYSINGWMLTDPECRKWTQPFITFSGMYQANGQEANVGDVTGRFHNVNTTDPMDTEYGLG